MTEDPDESGSAPDERRLDLYRYVGGAQHTGDYLTIVRLFGSGLLIDLSAAEVADRLAEHTGTWLSLDTRRGPLRCPRTLAMSVKG